MGRSGKLIRRRSTKSGGPRRKKLRQLLESPVKDFHQAEEAAGLVTEEVSVGSEEVVIEEEACSERGTSMGIESSESEYN